MPGEYLKGFPDPPNSPNEKFLLPSTPHLWQDDLYRDLINNGCPHDLALAISRSIAQHEDRKAILEQHEKKSLEWWANTHTHPGGTDGGTPGAPTPTHLIAVTAGTGQNYVFHSDDGESWSSTPEATGIPTGGFLSADWDEVGQQYIALGSNRRVYLSPDGYTWGEVTPSDIVDTTNYIVRLPEWGLYLATGSSDGSGGVKWSENLVDWFSPLSGALNAAAGQLTWDGDRVIAFRNASNGGFWSLDGKNWDDLSMPASSLGVGLWAGQYWLAGGSSGATHTSLDGDSWVAHESALPSNMGAGWARPSGFAVIGTGGGGFYTTVDGEVFTEVRAPEANRSVRDIYFTGTRWLVGGERGYISYSSDAENWTTVFPAGGVLSERSIRAITGNVPKHATLL